ncbi:MAG: LacI family transcriptional regulator [Clostridiales bacterium]|nr:LacI family transcriptional regulator [Clostridiales bacterium]
MSATIRDVAKLAKVSPATVSRYFSGSNVVGAELSKRIETAANTLGYVPTRDVRRNQGVILVLCPNLQLGYFSEVLKEIIKQMPKYKCRVVIIPTLSGDDSYKSFLTDLYVIGVIYLDEDIAKEMIHYIRAKNIRLVMLGGATLEERCDMVHINDMSAAYEGMKYLLSLNHRDILILADFPQSFSSGFQRMVGCQQAMKEAGIPFDEEQMVMYGDLTYERGWQSTALALKKGKRFTAVFAFSDEVALGSISALAESGLRVPEDISVLGFDGISISDRVVPKLTTIYQPVDKMVEWTLNTICNMDKQQTEAMEYTLPYRLLERGTCKRREEE